MDINSLNLQTIGALASITGLFPSFVQWFTSEYHAKKSKKKEKTEDIIEHYLEWLRRQRHNEILKKLSDSKQAQNELHNLINQLMETSKKDRDKFLTRLEKMDSGLHTKLDVIVDKLSESGLREKPEVKAKWPEVSLPLGGPKVSVPFAGRKEELKELTKAMGGNETVVAIVGLAGQGKSCLAGEWLKSGARPPKGIGLFWRKLYEPGFTFDIFLDHLHLYLTGRHINRQQITSMDARAAIVNDLLRERPCWIVLDGAERWLKRWADRPDAGVEDITADDRAAQEPALDKFLKGANFWDNGSKLLLTTRAVPGALDENLPVRIGRKPKDEDDKSDVRLDNLAPTEAVGLLKYLKVKGDQEIMLKAADTYGNHPYAVHVLGALIRDLYHGNVAEWEKVNPLEEAKLDDLFEKIIEHRKDDFGLLVIIACSVTPVPSRLLTETLVLDENQIRRKLSELAKWQMVEFTQSASVDQHAVVRRFLTERLGEKEVKELQKSIARWWVEQKVPDMPENIEQLRPLLNAVEHLLAAREPKAATDVFLSKWSEECLYAVGEWLWMFGYLEELNRILGDAIKIYIEVIEKESRLELRNDLAGCYNNRGLAYRDQGRLDEAIDDYDKAIKIREQLVEKENRQELRHDLAMCYNNLGLAYRDQGRLDEAIEDYGKAIQIYKQLVERENRQELRNDLAMCYNNRGLAHSSQSKLDEAIDDYGKAIKIREQLVTKESRRELRSNIERNLFNRAVALSEKDQWQDAKDDIEKGASLLTELIEEGRRHVIESFMQTAGFRCSKAKEFGDIPTASIWANMAMQWFLEEVKAARTNQVLLKRAAGFAGVLKQTWEILIQHGLDKELMENFFKTLNEEIEKFKPKQQE